jgi:hypothetical protein
VSLRGRLAKAKPKPFSNGEIVLSNPVRQHFPAFIFGNATMCSAVVEKDSALGQHIVICGAGPSLVEAAPEYCAQGDQVWGCNSALTYLVDRGLRVTHGFTVDQQPQMLEEWLTAPDVEYLLASSVHPHLTQYLQSKGRRTRFFHNFVGVQGSPVHVSDGRVIEYEDWLYSGLYAATCRVGAGLNATTRGIELARWMGAAKITVLGADCALKVNRPPPEGMVKGSPDHVRWLTEDVVMHADGGHALASGATAITMEGEVDGRMWTTKPDMMITATYLVGMKKALGDTLQLVGDTLPNALMDKDDAFLARLPHIPGPGGKPLSYEVGCVPVMTPIDAIPLPQDAASK